jgi:hypothetical protein
MSRRPPFMIVSDMELLHPTSKTHKERSWKAFLAGGTRHSPLAQTLPDIIRRCEREGVAYQLTAAPGLGYHIRPMADAKGSETQQLLEAVRDHLYNSFEPHNQSAIYKRVVNFLKARAV